jgi:colanic acid/amylovoran biosynthesis protein
MMPQLKNLAKKVIKSVWSTHAYGRLNARLAGLSASRRPNSAGQESPRLPLVLAAPGDGNIGDQAMFDSLLDNVPGPLRVIVSSAESLSVPPRDQGRVDMVVLPSLIHGLVHRRMLDIRRFSALLPSASLFLVMGADTMDGGHPHASLARFDLLRMAAERDIPAAVLGFSWASVTPDSILDALRETSPKLRLFPRDPVSAGRLRAAGAENVDESADLTFTYHETQGLPAYIQEWLDDGGSRHTGYAIINNSGLIRRRVTLDQEYGPAIRQLRERGLRILFLPHVLRPFDDDLPACRDLYQQFGVEDDLLVGQQLAPAQIKRLTEGATLTVTGRMHLAIMSLSQGTMPITMATAGKVEGLYELFQLPFGLIQPVPGCGRELEETTLSALSRFEELSDHISSRLGDVRELSQKNWDYIAEVRMQR